MGQKRKNRNEKDDFEYDPAPKHLQIAHIKNQEKRLIVILEKAQLESVKVRLCYTNNLIYIHFLLTRFRFLCLIYLMYYSLLVITHLKCKYINITL